MDLVNIQILGLIRMNHAQIVLDQVRFVVQYVMDLALLQFDDISNKE